MNTLAINVASWDMSVDGSANIAIASGTAAVAQDVASAVSVFLGEMYYDITFGIPYLATVMGQSYAPALVGQYLEQVALTVPTVVSAKAFITSFQNRKISGSIQVIDTTGQTLGISF